MWNLVIKCLRNLIHQLVLKWSGRRAVLVSSGLPAFLVNWPSKQITLYFVFIPSKIYTLSLSCSFSHCPWTVTFILYSSCNISSDCKVWVPHSSGSEEWGDAVSFPQRFAAFWKALFCFKIWGIPDGKRQRYIRVVLPKTAVFLSDMI